jgi:GNAT superfamily N-acetyltransferase
VKPESGVIIRRATSADLDTVVELRIALLREYPDHPIYGRLRPDAERRARPVFAAQLDSGNEAIFLAVVDGEVAGLIRCVETASSPLLTPDRYCYVSSAYVRPEFRRRGILRRLLKRARAWCLERGMAEMRLHSVGTRESSAAAWQHLGFEVVEQVRVLRLDSPPRVAGEAQIGDSHRQRLQP